MKQYRSKRRGNKKSGQRWNKKRYNKKVGLRQPVQYFKRSVYLPAFVVSSTTTTTPFVSSFALTDLPNNTEFRELYDQYKIMGVKWKLMPRYNSVDLNLNGGRVSTVIDYDDSNLITSYGDLTQYQNLKMTHGAITHSRYLKPRFSLSSIGASAIPVRNYWIDVASPNQAYRGIKGILDSTSSVVSYDLVMTYYLAFKCVR